MHSLLLPLYTSSMLLLPIRTKILKQGDHFVQEILKNAELHSGDILVVSSKAIAMTEGAQRDLKIIKPSPEAQKLAEECNQDPRFTQAVLDETKRMNGTIVGTCPFALLTSLKPNGMKTGRILCPNAGLDQSNVASGSAIGWPRDPLQSIRKLRQSFSIFNFLPLEAPAGAKWGPFSILISDSCCRPSRLGVTAFALVCAGIDPLRSEIGKKDLFGKKLRVTYEAVADQLATAANAVMGNADQCCPAAIIRDHGYPLSDFCGWVDGIEDGEDMFQNLFQTSSEGSLKNH